MSNTFLHTLDNAPDQLVGTDNAHAVNLTVKERIGTDTKGEPIYRGLVLTYWQYLDWRRND